MIKNTTKFYEKLEKELNKKKVEKELSELVKRSITFLAFYGIKFFGSG